MQIENLFTRRAMSVTALVDSAAVFFTVPEHLAVQLGFDLTEVGTREVVLANGHRELAGESGTDNGFLVRIGRASRIG